MELLDKAISALLVARLVGGMAMRRLGRPPGWQARLFDGAAAPVERPVVIHWHPRGIPFVEAETDADCAFGLGVAHAHLRLAQMELMRLLARGRLAEALGPAALDLDHALRLIGFDRAVPAMLARLPEPTRIWIDAFAQGIGFAQARAPLPPELTLLGLGNRPWDGADVLAVGRLVSADVNWLVLFNLLKLRGRADWPERWRELAGHEGAAFASLRQAETDLAAAVATGFARGGSNAVAVAGGRSLSGGALMAADPHLNLLLPNTWLVAGMKSPSYHAAGLMIPGLPFVAIGRNRAAAWSGTSLQAASSDIFDAAGLAMRARALRLNSRWGKTRELELREAATGPIVSDCRRLGLGGTLSLKWMGHAPSDEMSAWLAINRATSWAEFARAADGIAVPGQTLLYADAAGHVGKLMAVRLPRRRPELPADVVLPASELVAWREPVSSRALPQILDPPGGLVISANEVPRHQPVRVGLFFSSHDRYVRLHRLLGGGRRLGLDDLAAAQLDVASESALNGKEWLLRRLEPGHPLAPQLAQWDGGYDVHSRGATIYERLVGEMADMAGIEDYWASWNPGALLRRRLAGADDRRLRAALAASADRVAAERPGEWGTLHRLRLPHMLGVLPGAARLFRCTDLPMGGGNETLMKTAHGLAGSAPHPVRFGANARFLTDLADADSSRVVLLGGQDGWLGSDCFLDQVALWRRGETVALPLEMATVRAAFPIRMVLRP